MPNKLLTPKEFDAQFEKLWNEVMTKNGLDPKDIRRPARKGMKVNPHWLTPHLHAAWEEYTELFGEPPHGTLAQIAAMLELGVRVAITKHEEKAIKNAMRYWRRINDRT